LASCLWVPKIGAVYYSRAWVSEKEISVSAMIINTPDGTCIAIHKRCGFGKAHVIAIERVMLEINRMKDV
jgi:hypothetical protein